MNSMKNIAFQCGNFSIKWINLIKSMHNLINLKENSILNLHVHII